VHSCNDPATLNYISQPNSNAAGYNLHEAGINFDGPLFDLPGGTLRGPSVGIINLITTGSSRRHHP
jgi:hypothetical protein